MPVPTHDKLFNPLLAAIKALGGSATIAEQESAVAEALKLTDKEINEIHRGNRSKLSYRLAWARNYLKRYGVIDNSERGVWSLTPKGLNNDKLDEDEVSRVVRALAKTEGAKAKQDSTEEAIATWDDDLLELIKTIPSDAFERLCQRLLRESGFVQVEVTGRSGDGGIDGKGVVRLGGLLSFHVYFQCKRYKGSVASATVRDFRGALVGRADKGLVITTGTFTKDARAEAQRDGATPIDLIDGEELVLKLKDLRIGVQVSQKIVEEVVVNREYFTGL